MLSGGALGRSLRLPFAPLVESDGSNATTRFAVTVTGDTFTLRQLSTPPTAIDRFIVSILYESGPFNLQR